MKTIPNDTVSLKELRQEFPKYISAIEKGQSFTVVKRSKPIFQISPVNDGGNWQTVADLTLIDEKGVSADKVIEALS